MKFQSFKLIQTVNFLNRFLAGIELISSINKLINLLENWVQFVKSHKHKITNDRYAKFYKIHSQFRLYFNVVFF